MRNNHLLNEDPLTKIERSKSRNQMSYASKLKEKVPIGISRKPDGMIDFILITSPSTTITMNPSLNVISPLFRPQKQISYSQPQVSLFLPRNDSHRQKKIPEQSL